MLKGRISQSLLSRIMGIEPIRRQGSIAFLASILITGIGFVSTMVFAHLLGPEIMGGYFLFLAYYGIIDLFFDGGLGAAAVKRISEGSEQDEFFSAFLFLRVSLIVILLVLLYIVRDLFVDLNQEGLFAPLLIALAAGLFFSTGYNANLGTGNIGISKTGEVLNFLVKVLIQIIAVFLGFGLFGLAGGVVAGLLAGAAICWRYVGLRFRRFGLRHVRSLTLYAFWVFLAASGTVVFSYTDVIVIGYFLSNTEVGVYRVATQLTSAATFTAFALQIALFPRMSRWAAEGDRLSIGRTLNRALSYAQFLAIPVLFGGTVLGDRLLFYLYGAAFTEGAAFLPVLLLSQVVNVCLILLSSTLSALNRPEMAFRAITIAAVLNLILNILFIPIFGMTGAALATLIAISLNALLSYRFVSSEIAVRFDRGALMNIVSAAAVMLLVVAPMRYLLPDTGALLTILTVAAGASVYLMVLFRLDRRIKEDLLNIFRQLGVPVPLFIERF